MFILSDMCWPLLLESSVAVLLPVLLFSRTPS
jgi:hypothetical protein